MAFSNLFLLPLLLAACEGPQGPQGDPGLVGDPGLDGADGLNGVDGADGADGQDAAAPGTLAGIVSTADGDAVEGAYVTTTPDAYVVQTDSWGRFVMPGLAVGSYQVVASADGWSDATATVDVTSGAVTTQDFVLDGLTGSIAVFVQDADGGALAGAAVTLSTWDWGADGWAEVSTGSTDAAGACTFPDLSGSLYAVRAAYATSDDWLPTESRWSLEPGDSVTLTMNANLYEEATEGSSLCLMCHDGGTAAPDASDWRGTMHAVSLRVPGETSDLQDLSGWPDADAGLEYFEPDGAFDNTGAGDEWGYVVDLSDATYYVFLGHDADGYYVQFSDASQAIFSDRYDVVLTQGGEGKYKQRYWVRLDESTWLNAATMDDGVSHYVLPIQFNETAEATSYDPIWASYNASRWTSPTTEGGRAVNTSSMTLSKSVEANCSGCHFNDLGVSGDSTNGFDAWSNPNSGSNYDWDGDGSDDEIDTGCEACHGPGGAHGGGAADVMNPAYMTVDAANLVCGRCHTRVESMWEDSSGFAHEFPWTEDGEPPRPGVDEDLSTSAIAALGLWTDATGATTIYAKQHHQQWDDYLHSAHQDNPYARLTCFTCHDAHSAAQDAQIVSTIAVRRDGEEVEVAGVSSDDNTLCLACHAGYGDFADVTLDDVQDVIDGVDDTVVGEAVTYHSDARAGMGGTAFYDPTDTGFGNCVSCHMPRTAKTAHYTYNGEGEIIHADIRSHSFGVILPEVSRDMEEAGISATIPNSCGSCHEEWVY